MIAGDAVHLCFRCRSAACHSNDYRDKIGNVATSHFVALSSPARDGWRGFKIFYIFHYPRLYK